jgi:hypothetical protein
MNTSPCFLEHHIVIILHGLQFPLTSHEQSETLIH